MTVTPVQTAQIIAKGWGWRHAGRQAWAVRNLDLAIEPGERILLAGASGAGKSTLLHGLAGILDPNEGDVEGTLQIANISVESTTLRGRVGLVQQDPESQVVMSRVGDEVAFGLENTGVPSEEIWPRVREALDAVGLDVPLDRQTAHLSGGQKQRLALACAFAMRPEVVLLDEPTANLDPAGAAELRWFTQKVVEQTGATLVLVEHDVEPWLDQIDRIVVLDHGSLLAAGPPQTVLTEQAERLREAGVWVPGESVQEVLRSAPEVELPQQTWAQSLSESPLRTSDLTVGYAPEHPVNWDMNLAVDPQLPTCIVGPNGAGKTTLALTLAGLLDSLEGEVIATKELRGTLGPNPEQWSGPELLGRVSMVFQEPAYQFLTSTVEEELRLGPTLMSGEDAESEEQIEALVNQYLRLLRLEHLRKAHPQSLSGGEKRRLSVASALISAPRVLILDEPTFGQDRNTWAALVQLLRAVSRKGTAVVSVTHDLRLLEGLDGKVIQIEAPDRSTEGSTDGSTEDHLAGRSPDHLAQRSTKTASRAVKPKRAFIKSVNPVAQLIGLVVLTVPLMVTIDVISAAVALGAEILLLPSLGMSPKRILKRIWPLLVAAPLTVVSMLLYGTPAGTVYWEWGPAAITSNSIMLATALGLRVLAVGMPAILLLSRIDATDMADALTQVLHLPSRIVLASLAGIRMGGLMVADWKALARARRSRGLGAGNRFRAFYQGAFAMLTFALRRAGTLSLTMEARGFGSENKRSVARASKLSSADLVMVLVCAAVSAASLGVAVAAGSFRWFGL